MIRAFTAAATKMGCLDGKTCVVTGAGRGIGKAIALELAKEGGHLVLCSRTKTQLEEVAQQCKELGAGEAHVITCDFSNPASVTELAQRINENHGGADVLVNNAGMAPSSGMTPLEGEPDDWDHMLMVNLGSVMRLTRLLSPGMVEKKAGAIINIGSVAAVEPMTSACAYAATKHGLRGWSLSCYQALRAKNIKVSLINPGMVNTDMSSGFKGANPARMLQPEDIAAAAMLVIKTTPMCVPEEITLRITIPVSEP